MERGAGILLPISSLPSEYGIGCFSGSAYRFIDKLRESGQKYWQILPLGPTSFGDSPYQSFSTFAGNPYFISLKELVSEGLLKYDECENTYFGDNPERVDYYSLYKNRLGLLHKAYERADIKNHEGFINFCQNNLWLEDYCLFMALKDKFGGKDLYTWNRDIRLRKPDILESCRRELDFEINFYRFIQYKFYEQWKKLKSYANNNGIKIIGDIPIYVALDSAEVWANPELFQLDKNNVPISVAGCPPDGFSAEGQLWGNPLYDWETHKRTDYKWWISRLKHCFGIYDVVRIDHFRGFDEYFSIPYGSKTAAEGHWAEGPGMSLFRAVEKALGKKEVVAEDLGFITDSVKRLVEESGFPNMKVLEFAFDSRDTGDRADYLPHNYGENCIAYTGTHDNQTIVSWTKTISEKERDELLNYLSRYEPDGKEIHKRLISLVMKSKANVCIIPIQDWLGFDDSCRMNTPSTTGVNWRWRMSETAFDKDLCSEIRRITIQSGR